MRGPDEGTNFLEHRREQALVVVFGFVRAARRARHRDIAIAIGQDKLDRPRDRRGILGIGVA